MRRHTQKLYRNPHYKCFAMDSILRPYRMYVFVLRRTGEVRAIHYGCRAWRNYAELDRHYRGEGGNSFYTPQQLNHFRFNTTDGNTWWQWRAFAEEAELMAKKLLQKAERYRSRIRRRK